MSDRYFPDDLLTRAEGAALLRRCGCFNAADALERGIAAPAHLSHNGVPLFRWGTLACWADERRAAISALFRKTPQTGNGILRARFRAVGPRLIPRRLNCCHDATGESRRLNPRCVGVRP